MRKELIEKLHQTMHLLNCEKRTARDYGTGCLLFHSEVSLLEAINNHQDANASELSECLDITNGAVTQVAKKLIKKGLIDTYKLYGNKKEVYFKLTELGKLACQGHEAHHTKMEADLLRYLDSLGEKTQQYMMELFDIIANSIPLD